MGVKTPSKLAQNRLQSCSFFYALFFLFLDGLLMASRHLFSYFHSSLVSSALRNYGFCIGKEHFSKLVLLCFSQRPTAVWAPLGLSCGLQRQKMGSKTFSKGVSKWCLKIKDILIFFGGDFGSKNCVFFCIFLSFLGCWRSRWTRTVPRPPKTRQDSPKTARRGSRSLSSLVQHEFLLLHNRFFMLF